MVRRLKAMLMLLIVGLVLPAAGSPHRFCTLGCPGFATAADCVETDGGCCDPEPGSSDEPECVAVLKFLPDALPPEIPRVSSEAIAGRVPVEVSPPLASWPDGTGRSRDREPPGPLRLYLMKRSLLL